MEFSVMLKAALALKRKQAVLGFTEFYGKDFKVYRSVDVPVFCC